MEKLKGAYAFASGEPETSAHADNPEWQAGYAAARENHARGLDVRGNPHTPPHLCVRDVRKVCACNASTQRHCTVAVYPPSQRAAGTSFRDWLRRMWKGDVP